VTTEYAHQHSRKGKPIAKLGAQSYGFPNWRSPGCRRTIFGGFVFKEKAGGNVFNVTFAVTRFDEG
jgi:hypothetical protein